MEPLRPAAQGARGSLGSGLPPHSCLPLPLRRAWSPWGCGARLLPGVPLCQPVASHWLRRPGRRPGSPLGVPPHPRRAGPLAWDRTAHGTRPGIRGRVAGEMERRGPGERWPGGRAPSDALCVGFPDENLKWSELQEACLWAVFAHRDPWLLLEPQDGRGGVRVTCRL